MGKQKDGEDSALFREHMREVKRLHHNRVAPKRRRPAPIPKQRLADEAKVREEMLSDTFDGSELETGEEVLYVRPGLQHGLIRKLRRGHFSVQAELDLHGHTVAEARQALADFLAAARAGRARCVRIVHGKGHSSPNKIPILKTKLNHWLRQLDDVLAFCSARPIDGGTGAVYVLLKRYG